MDTATKNLENDHVNILRVIDIMEKMTAWYRDLEFDVADVKSQSK